MKKQKVQITKEIPQEPDRVNVRWEEGYDHHPKSKRLMQFMRDYDFKKDGDFFCWKVGGDGDNGEILMYQLDALFEMLDKKGESL